MGAKGSIKRQSGITAEPELKCWSNGRIRKKPKEITSLNYTLHYAAPCVWEGIRAYTQADKTTKVWKLKEHMERLHDSAKIMGFEIPYPVEELVAACRTLVEANGGGDLYFRPVAYSANSAESAKPQHNEINVDIYAFKLQPLHEGSKDSGVKLIISQHPRGYPMYQMQAKTAANYGFLELVKPELRLTGADDALFLDKDGFVVEATVANIWIFKNNIALTPPNEGSILPGVTRKTLAGVLSNMPLMIKKYNKPTHVTEKRLTKADIYTADCMILCGTYAEVVLVDEVDGRKIGNDKTRDYYKILKNEYDGLVRGRVKNP